jgi:epoxyqueuosine reductase
MDLFGVSPAERLSSAPEGFRPEDYLPGAKSVIVLGCHFPEASALQWEKGVYSYQYYGYAIINKELGHAAFSIAKGLEEAGFLALPFVPTVYPKDMDYHSQSAEFSHRHAAVAAGLGEFGLSGLVINERYGTRVRFISIITTCEIPPDEMCREQKLCDRCMKCVDVCPSNALQEAFEVSFDMDGTTFRYIQVDRHRCYYNIMGMGPGSGGIINEPIKQKPGRIGHKVMVRSLLRALRKHPSDFVAQLGMQIGVDWVDYCGRCLHVCLPNPRDLK